MKINLLFNVQSTPVFWLFFIKKLSNFMNERYWWNIIWGRGLRLNCFLRIGLSVCYKILFKEVLWFYLNYCILSILWQIKNCSMNHFVYLSNSIHYCDFVLRLIGCVNPCKHFNVFKFYFLVANLLYNSKCLSVRN